jgi:phage gp29-like protein
MMPTTPQLVASKQPPKGEIVERSILESRQFSTLTLARGFAGVANPTTIWQEMISDSQNAFYYFRELEEKDGHVASLLEQLKLSVLGLEQQVTPADDSAEALRAAEFIQQQFAGISGFHQVLDCLLDAPAYGVSIAENIYDVSSGQVGLLAVKDRPQEMFTFNPLTLPQIGPLRFMRTLYDLAGGELVPEEKFLVFSFRPRNGNRRGRPLLRRNFWPSWFRRQTLRFWLRFGEKGPGTIVVKYAAGATDSEKNEALRAAEAIRDSVAVAVPENFALVEALLQAARSQNPAVYKQLIDEMKAEIAVNILGQTLTSSGSDKGAGSFALGKVHSDVKFERTVEVAGMLETVINDQLVKRLVMWNFGPGVPAPKWNVLKEDPEDLGIRIKVDDGLQQMGLDIPEAYARKKYGVPEIKAGDNVLERRASTSPFAPGIGAPGQSPGQAGQFSEGGDLSGVQGDWNRMGDQLKADALDVFRDRIAELAKQIRPQAPQGREGGRV